MRSSSCCQALIWLCFIFNFFTASKATKENGCTLKELDIFHVNCHSPGKGTLKAPFPDVVSWYTYCDVTCPRAGGSTYRFCDEGTWTGPYIQCEEESTEGGNSDDLSDPSEDSKWHMVKEDVPDSLRIALLKGIMKRMNKSGKKSALDPEQWENLTKVPRERIKRDVSAWLRGIQGKSKPARYRRVVQCSRRRRRRRWSRRRRRRRHECQPVNVKDPLDYTPPVLTCPTIKTQLAPEGKRSAKVTWNEPTLKDGQCSTGNLFKKIKPTAGKGSEFNEGVHEIYYEAHDCNYNTDTCQTIFNVEVRKCPQPMRPAYGTVTCNTADYIWGTVCTFSCNKGYSVSGHSSQHCGANKKWSSGGTVACKKISCGAPPAPANSVKKACSDGTLYGSSCLFTCKSGYWRKEGDFVFRCNENKQWVQSGGTSPCTDATPPVIKNLPANIITYADEASETATISWQEPVAEDNKDGVVVPVQVAGKPSGSKFGAGTHLIKYSATDSKGNQAEPKSFTITVNEIQCQVPKGSEGLNINCPQGYTFGFSCTFSCGEKYELVGPSIVKCKKTNTTPPSGYWDWSSPPYCKVDNNPPTLVCPQISSPIQAEKFSVEANVFWEEPTASDVECSNVNVYQLLPTPVPSGSSFKEGNHEIPYEATDCHSNRRICSVKFEVKVSRCIKPSNPNNGRVECSASDLIWGETCTFYCNSGFDLVGTSNQECDQTGQWSGGGVVSCKKIDCGSYTIPPAVELTACSEGTLFESVCTFHCKSGLTSKSPGSAYLVCDATGTWTGSIVECEDKTPPTFDYCPADIFTHVEKAKNSALVTWNEPVATDIIDDAVTVQQVGGLPSGSSFSAGVHFVTYDAIDSAGNKAPQCSFTISIRKITCSMTFGSPLLISCPGGNVFGSTCTVSCPERYYLVGSTQATCEINTSTDPPSGVWEFGANEPEARCEEDNTPPVITCPTIPSVVYPPKGAREVVVTWDNPTTVDTQCTDVTLQQVHPIGRSTGSLFPIGSHSVIYSAEDCSFNTAQCTISFEVKLKKCQAPRTPDDSSYQCTTLDGILAWGTTCDVKCDPGYEPDGPTQIECLEDETWSTAPICNKLTCPSPPSFQTLVLVTCTDYEYQFQSACSYQCVDGTAPKPSANTLTTCSASGKWEGTLDECNDIEPPVIFGCPDPLVFYADKLSTTATVTWTAPTVTDNIDSSVIIQQIEGPPPGSSAKGQQTIIYTAQDMAGNQAQPCSFIIDVQLITCPEIVKTQYLDISCDYSNLYGSNCTFTCAATTSLVGGPNATCDKTSDDPPEGMWNWGASNSQPFCDYTDCPDLPAPGNGALACYEITSKICSVQCNEEFDFPSDQQSLVSQLFGCDLKTGQWRPNTFIPDCLETRQPGGSTTFTFRFFSGDCNSPETQEQIKNNFVSAINDPNNEIIFKNNWCSVSGSCTVSDVEVTCGPIISVRKRDLNYVNKLLTQITDLTRVRRSNHFSHKVTITFKLTIFLLSGQIPHGGMDSVVNDIGTAFQESVADGSFSFNVDGFDMTIDPNSVTFDNTSTPVCPVGLGLNPLKLTCTGCDTGMYHNISTGQCESCPIGQYEDEGNSLSCKICPENTSTKTTRIKSESLCIETCSAGHYSSDGFQPCKPCPRGTYQNIRHQTECLSCSDNFTTAASGSSSPTDCLNPTPCDPNPCTGYTCIKNGLNYTCQCADGHTGLNCEITPSNCDHHSCQNGATCENTASSYTCICTYGFTGQYCEHGIGVWADWMPWTPCTFACGGGQRIRYRHCSNPPLCSKNIQQEDGSCNTHPCTECSSLTTTESSHKLDCKKSLEFKLELCSLSCLQGKVLSEPNNNVFYCDPSTSFKWSHQIEDAGSQLPSCISPCNHGNYLDDSSACRPCPVGEYQDRKMQRSCEKCPTGTTTLQEGATSLDHCLATCEQGSYSKTGYEPCTLCERDSYQTNTAQLECLPCPPGTGTLSIGAMECISKTCNAGFCNGHPCVQEGLSISCQCPAGTSEPYCESHDPCEGNPCRAGATCTRDDKGFLCACPSGYTGKLCDQAVVAPSWSTWEKWSECTVSCASGTRSRSRVCSSSSSDSTSKTCQGDSSQEDICNTHPCPGCASLLQPEGTTITCTPDQQGGKICVLQCKPGLQFEFPPESQYICTKLTGFQWKHLLRQAVNAHLPKCIDICPAGNHLDIATSSCLPCKVGYFQDHAGQSECKLCPPGTRNRYEGSSSIEDCEFQCLPGSYSSTGLYPCSKCPEGQYQSVYGQMSCIQCPAGTKTLTQGSAEEEDCVGESSPCVPNPCRRGICREQQQEQPQSSSYSCECETGYTGQNCEVPPPVCMNHLCENGGTCVPDDSDTEWYTCDCPEGFSGRRCSIEIVDGGWNDWSAWLGCYTCGVGTQNRTRICNNPEPLNGGKPCPGDEMEEKPCELCKKCEPLEVTSVVQKTQCTTDEEDNSMECVLYCEPGLEFEFQPLSTYTCGVDTDYQWSHISFNLKIPHCVVAVPPKKINIKSSVNYPGLNCGESMDEQKISSAFKGASNAAMSSSSCRQNNGNCKSQVKVIGCGSNKKKRSVGGTTVEETLETNIDWKLHASLDGNYDKEAMYQQENSYFDQMFELYEVAYKMNETAMTGGLEMTIDGETFTPDSSGFSQTSAFLCPDGTAKSSYTCVECPVGTFSNGEKCQRCPLNFYQDETGKTSCKPCPEGTSTTVTHSTSVDNCIGESNDLPIDVKPNSSLGDMWYIVVVLVIGILLLLLAIFTVINCQRKKNKLKIQRRIRTQNVHSAPHYVPDLIHLKMANDRQYPMPKRASEDYSN